MNLFYTTRDIVIPQNISKTTDDFPLAAPTSKELSTLNIRDKYLYVSTYSHANKIKKAVAPNTHKSPIKLMPRKKLAHIKNRRDFPLNLYPKLGTNEPIPLEKKITSLRNKKSIKIVIINGFGTGLGDSIVGLTAYRLFYKELQKYFEEVKIDLCQLNKARSLQIYEKEKNINRLIQLPISLEKLRHYDAFIDLGGIVSWEEFNNQSLLDFYLTVFSLKHLTFSKSEKRNSIQVVPSIQDELRSVIAPLRNHSKLLLFHPTASNMVRSIPENKQDRILQELLAATDYTIISAVETNYDHPRIKDLSYLSTSVDHLIGIISLMDAIITVDTVIYHISECFNIPTVVLFTTINPALRTSYYPNVKSISLIDSSSKLYGIHKTKSEYAKVVFNQLWANFDVSKILALLPTHSINTVISNNSRHSIHANRVKGNPRNIKDNLTTAALGESKQKNLFEKSIENYSPPTDLVSIIIPTYNREKYIGEAIDSVLAQTYSNWELIIVDDGSNDKTRDIIKKYQSKDSRIRLFYHRKNKGVSAARNKGILTAEGKYINFLDSDDMLLPDAIYSLLITISNEPPNVKVVYGDYYKLKHNIKTYIKLPNPETKPFIFIQLLYRNIISMNSVIVEKDAAIDIGIFDTTLNVSEDFDFWARMIVKYDIRKIAIPLAFYRFHSEQSMKDMSAIRDATDIACFKYLKSIELQNCFPNISNDEDLADAIEQVAKKMQKRPATPYDTILEIYKIAQSINYRKTRENRIAFFTNLIPEMLKKYYPASKRISSLESENS